MALTAPALTPRPSHNSNPRRSKAPIPKILPRASLRLVPELRGESREEHRYFVIFVSILGTLGLLALLAINTLLAQDAFALHRLQLQAMKLNDQREAVTQAIAKTSSPDILAQRATSLGMLASQSPRFLTLAPDQKNSFKAKN